MARRLLVSALGAALALSGLAAAPARAATWPAPVEVAGPQPTFSYRYDPQTVVTPDGTAIASWVDTGALDSVMVAEHPAGGTWSTPVPVASANIGGNRLAVGPDGTLAIVYQTVVAGKVVVGAVVRPAGETWGSPETLSDNATTAGSPQVAVGAGQVTAVFVQGSGAAAQPVARMRPLGAVGAWTPPQTFADTGVGGVDVAAGTPGTLVTWVLSSDPGGSYPASTVRSSFLPSAGLWETPVSVSAGDRRVSTAEPAVGDDGTLAVTWESRLPGLDGYYNSARVLAAVRPPGGSWGSEGTLSDPSIEGRYPRIGVGPDGATTVVWESYDGATKKVVTRLHRAGSWSTEDVLTESVASQSDPRLAVGADGTAVVEFTDLEDGIGVAIRPPGAGWRPTDFVAPAAQDGYARALAVGAGTVAVLWIYPSDYSVLAVVADDLLPLPPLPPPPSPSAETGPVSGPAKVAKGKRAAYSFTGSPGSVTFQCRVDTTKHQQTGAKGKKGRKPIPWKSCDSPVEVRTKKLKLGKHTLYVRAVLAGVPDPTPSTKLFKVKAPAR
jgi:hypothetical protein